MFTNLNKIPNHLKYCQCLICSLVHKNNSPSFQKYTWPLFKCIISSLFFRCLTICEFKSFHTPTVYHCKTCDYTGSQVILEDDRWGILGLLKYKRKPLTLTCGVLWRILFLLPAMHLFAWKSLSILSLYLCPFFFLKWFHTCC